ncbi:sensor histidine kinase [Pseudactinotalea sp.]|uniref:sensor histidine kinase n=1 Tax=Pseudactinotalea sp. TaxID=1926260 RepID=UPI003B3BE62B
MTGGREHDGGAASGPGVPDIVLAVAVTAVLSAVIAVSQAGTGAAPHAVAYLFAAGFGAVLLLRRRMPVAVLALSVLGTFAYYTLSYPPIGVALPVVAALYSAAEMGLFRWAVGTGAVVFAVALAFRLRDDDQPVGYLLGTDAVSNLALIAAAIALGYGIRAGRERAAQQRELTRLTQEQTAREAELRMQSERQRISRDLHDTLGHSLSVITLHAGVGSEAVGRDDLVVTEALARVREQSTASLAELRTMVHLLRTDAEDSDERHVRSLADLPAIVGEAEAAGLSTIVAIDVDPSDLHPAVDAAAYRVIQEALTNVLRHAGATTARVSAAVAGADLHLTVTDNGHGATDRTALGYGISGMTERVRLLGGSLTTRSEPGDGFTVSATIPARLEP